MLLQWPGDCVDMQVHAGWQQLRRAGMHVLSTHLLSAHQQQAVHVEEHGRDLRDMRGWEAVGGVGATQAALAAAAVTTAGRQAAWDQHRPFTHLG